MLSKENNLFRYRIEGNHAVIETCIEDYPVVEFPKTIEGFPVTELDGYVLSGKNCEEVLIPEGIKKIGRYGFYNCRNLRKLTFSSDFMDIGSGAFTGCHHIREMNVLMRYEKEDAEQKINAVTVNGQTALREILTEVPEEICVTLIWKCKESEKRRKAVLWFPEFFEESIENTPARILSVQTHGSGMFYRNCFQGKVFQFAEYDKRFETACALESERFLMELVSGRLMYPMELGEKAKKKYEEFLYRHRSEMMKYWIDKKREEELEWIVEAYPHKREEQEEYKEIMEYAARKGTPAMISSLMEYGRKLFPPKRKSFEL